jgi:hypothetical protein
MVSSVFQGMYIYLQLPKVVFYKFSDFQLELELS